MSNGVHFWKRQAVAKSSDYSMANEIGHSMHQERTQPLDSFRLIQSVDAELDIQRRYF